MTQNSQSKFTLYQPQARVFNPFAPSSNTLVKQDQVFGLDVFSPSSTQYSEEITEGVEKFNVLKATRVMSEPAPKNDEELVLKRKHSGPTSQYEETNSEECDGSEEQEESQEENDNWNDKLDKILKAFATKCKYDWKKIAKKFNLKQGTEYTGVYLQHKYKQITKPSIPLRVKFTREEDLMIAKYFDQFGCDWTKIASHFTDRTPIMLKNRYYSHIRKQNLLEELLEEVHGVDKTEEDIDFQVKQEVKVEEEEEQHQLVHHVNQVQVHLVHHPERRSEVFPHTEDESKLFIQNFDGNFEAFKSRFGADYRFADYSNNFFKRQPMFDMESELRSELNEKVTVTFY